MTWSRSYLNLVAMGETNREERQDAISKPPCRLRRQMVALDDPRKSEAALALQQNQVRPVPSSVCQGKATLRREMSLWPQWSINSGEASIIYRCKCTCPSTYSVGSGFKELFKADLRTVVGTDLSTSMLEHQQSFPLSYHVQSRLVSSPLPPEDSREQAREAPCH